MQSALSLLCCVLLVLSLTVAGVAKPPALFTAKGLTDFTVQPPVNALGPIPANGTWAQEGPAIVATGTAAPWTVATAGSPAWSDYRLTLTLTIAKPAPAATYPIRHQEYDRYLPREDFPPGDHTGQYRYRYYAGEFDWGSDAAVFVRYQDREACYRVQFSTEYQEIILWHGTGGYLQVVPWKLVAGKAYRIEVRAQGAHLQVLVDGNTAIDYWHACAPTLSGGIGLGAYRSTMTFRDIAVAALPPAGAAPPHQPAFATRTWRTQRWIFDGREPITLLEKAGGEDDYHGKSLYFHFVKLRPGYRPLYLDWLAVRRGYTNISQLIGDTDAIKTRGEGSARLILDFDSITSDKLMRAHHTDALTYDAVRGAYRHDVTAELAFDGEQSAQLLEFSDPLTYNNKAPGAGVKYPWLYSGHDWGILTGEDGTLYRQPISEGLWMEGQDGWGTEQNPSRWILYPDRAVCPAWEVDVPGVQLHREICHWGYDFHQRIWWKNRQPRTFKAGDRFTIRYVMTGYPPRESERLFTAAPLHSNHAKPEPTTKIANLWLVPSAFAFPVCVPGGTDFSDLYSVRQPFVGWPFQGDYTMDREVGHNDRYSLRLDGPATVSGEFYHHMIDSNAKRYLCTVWLKTKGVQGKSPVVTLKYSYAATPCDRIDTGLYGDNDWQALSFITTVPVPTLRTYDSSTFIVEHAGQGTVWIDDFSVRPLADDATVTEQRPVSTAAAAPAPPVSPDFLIDLTADEGKGPCVADRSGRGNHGKLARAEWANAGGRPVLHFTGVGLCYITPRSSELQQNADNVYGSSALTLDAWVRPTTGGAIIGYMTSPMLLLEKAGTDTFTLRLSYASNGKGGNVVTKPLIKAGQWSHVAATIAPDGTTRLYVNGVEAAKGVIPGKLTFAATYRFITLGTYGKQYGNVYTGDMTNIRWWTREATPAEIAAAAKAVSW
jgi:hypothetical protein